MHRAAHLRADLSLIPSVYSIFNANMFNCKIYSSPTKDKLLATYFGVSQNMYNFPALDCRMPS